MYPLIARLLGSTASSFMPAGGGFVGAWEETFDVALASRTTGWANYTIRSAFDRFILKPKITKFRARFQTLGSDQLQITKAYIGVGSGLTYSRTPTQIFFGGNAGVTITSAGVECDEVSLDYTGTENVIFSYYCPSGAAGTVPAYSVGAYGLFNSYNGGDLATQVGGSWPNYGSVLTSMVELDTFIGDAWTETFKATSSPQRGGSGWGTHTMRTRFEVGEFPTGFANFRLGIAAQVSDIFIGNAVETAGSFAFSATPTRLLFNGANASPTNYDKIHMTDPMPLSILDLTKPVLVSYNNVAGTTFLVPFGSNTTGARSKYVSGNVAGTLPETGFVPYNPGLGDYMGPLVIDVQQQATFTDHFYLTNAAEQTLTAGTTPEIIFGTEVFDTAGVVAASRFTVPETMNGAIATLSASIRLNAVWNNETSLRIQRSTNGGSSWVDMCGTRNAVIQNLTCCMQSNLTTGEIYRVVLGLGGSGSPVVSDSDLVNFTGIITRMV